MAVVPDDTGYPMYWFKNKESVRDTFECSVCLDVIKDPVQVRDCGHQFCRYCLDRVLGLQAECPSCRKKISEEMVFTDNAAHRTIAKLEVNCPSSRCEWDGSLNSLLEEHTARCPFFLLNCGSAGCDIHVTRQEFEEHLTQCEKRIVVCEHCKSEHVFKEKNEHLATCPLLPVECTNQCSEKYIPRNEMGKHVETVCPKTSIQCKYLDFGCEHECERGKMKEHLNQAMQEHLDVSTLEISRLKEKSLKHDKEVKELETKIAAKCDREKMKEHLNQAMQGLSTLEISRLKEKSLKHDKEVKELETKIAAKYDKKIEEISAKYDKKMEEIAAKVNSATRPVMIIPDFNRKLSEAKENNRAGKICGVPFYTSPGGYKLMMSVTLNETKEDYKDHMGVYIRVMKSDYDAILPWPFKKKLTYTLIDQQDNEKEKKNIVRIIAPRGESSFERPKNEEKGRGIPNFVSHATLRTNKYIKDDTVFITLSIEL